MHFNVEIWLIICPTKYELYVTKKVSLGSYLNMFSIVWFWCHITYIILVKLLVKVLPENTQWPYNKNSWCRYFPQHSRNYVYHAMCALQLYYLMLNWWNGGRNILYHQMLGCRYNYPFRYWRQRVKIMSIFLHFFVTVKKCFMFIYFTNNFSHFSLIFLFGLLLIGVPLITEEKWKTSMRQLISVILMVYIQSSLGFFQR
jgi:hypothetical protein